ncbi:tRNA cyclic N6-threonylcarbamoyladenosine(37) synthase TcdA [Aliikangiella sp. IMCC44653]
MQDNTQEQRSLRFGGISRLYGKKAHAKFQQARVTVVGLGGVGSWAAEALARSDIGNIHLVDLDDICVTNTNRQIHADVKSVGQLKTQAMAERIKNINPDCQVTLTSDFISAKNQAEILADNPDFVIDAIDSVPAKVALLAFCKRNKIKVITTGGAGGQLDPTQISCADLSRTIQDPLAAKVRSELRRHYGFSKNPKRKFGIECIYSLEQLNYPQLDGETCQQKVFQDGSVKMDCEGGLGAGSVVTASFGMFAAARVLKKLAQS